MPAPAQPAAQGTRPPAPLVLLCHAVARFWRQELALPRGGSALLALSGGADSTALALIFAHLARRLDLTLYACTVNHGLRPDAAEDAAHTLRLCRGLGIPCSVRLADVRQHAARQRLGLEDAARQLRYALLEEERLAVGASWIVLGHHAGDVCEDLLLRLVRGAGWPALAGMRARDGARRLLRPLLGIAPELLRAALRGAGVAWREDSSNRDRRFRRNRLRQDVLPLLRAENPSLTRSVLNLWQQARLDETYWRDMLDRALDAQPWREDATGITLPRELLRGLPPAARLRLYLRVVRRLSGSGTGGGQARSGTLLALDAALREGRGNTRFQLPGGMEARLKGGGIRFTRRA